MLESLSFCKIEKARNCLQNSGLEKSKTADKLLACPPSVNIRLCRSSILHTKEKRRFLYLQLRISSPLKFSFLGKINLNKTALFFP